VSDGIEREVVPFAEQIAVLQRRVDNQSWTSRLAAHADALGVTLVTNDAAINVLWPVHEAHERTRSCIDLILVFAVRKTLAFI